MTDNETNLTLLNVNQIVSLLSRAYIKLIKNGTPLKSFPSVMLWGPPGIGKSQGVREIAGNIQAKTGKMVFITDVRLLLFNPVDLRGIPTANADKTLSVWLKPQIFQMDESEDVINILFLDEITAAPQSVQAAVLTGCKNIVSAQKSGEYAVWVPEWGVQLETAAPVRDGLRAIGIRAHAFDPAVSSNRFSVSWVGEMEEPFEWITQFRFANQQQTAAPVWRRFSKRIAMEKYPMQLGVSPQDILLLYHR